MIKKENYKQILIIGGLLLTIIIGAISYLISNNYFENQDEFSSFEEISSEQIINEEVENDKTVEEEKQEIVVHITGQVVNPGIVKLKDGARVIDAIEAAGGATQEANLSLINLAYILEDGMKIYVPSIKDKEEIEIVSSQRSNGSNKVVRVNINTASSTELEKLPGVGSSIASRIIAYRTENGKFSTIEDLKNVNGIGESKFNNIKAYVYVK